ncbi:hypothetical protein AG1IA_03617 [Rhizoctonia solani AG-1 IA]|uniref:Uncharacterized protein n=1 Tax=Thanatephorus cucumeris (strain AG1-IA) TaxID=983506 RepID=L8WWA5_THACA|nr:hypothetical protein AG1IA_03617 [Rhizoctonia solani AG-1 IA]
MRPNRFRHSGCQWGDGFKFNLQYPWLISHVTTGSFDLSATRNVYPEPNCPASVQVQTLFSPAMYRAHVLSTRELSNLWES